MATFENPPVYPDETPIEWAVPIEQWNSNPHWTAIRIRHAKHIAEWDWIDFLLEGICRWCELESYDDWWICGIMGG